jgi:hypothetical protein
MEDLDPFDEPLLDFAELKRRNIVDGYGHLTNLINEHGSRLDFGRVQISIVGRRDRFGNGWLPGRPGSRLSCGRAPPSRQRHGGWCQGGRARRINDVGAVQ